jgi:hypothetical protein
MNLPDDDAIDPKLFVKERIPFIVYVFIHTQKNKIK